MKTIYTMIKQIKNCMRRFALLGFLLSGFTMITKAQAVSDFENLTLSAESYWNGSDGSGGFASGDAYFENSYDAVYGFWSSGFAYSNSTDNTTAGYTNQYSAYTGSGYNGSDNYGIVYGNSILKLTGVAKGSVVSGFYLTNTTYAGLSMKNGDSFAKQFGGASGNDADWFKVGISGFRGNNPIMDTVDFYLADFRFADNTQDYILNTWEWADLTSLGTLDSLTFTFSSSDVGIYGMNTPAYIAIDNFNHPLFAPQAGQTGTTAMYKDSSVFVGWATGCTVVRGPQDISNVSSANATVGDNTSALGAAGLNGGVSLGDGGSATLTFASPVMNGAGPDFAIFENGFSVGTLDYLELGFVEVSSDGIQFFRFPSASFTDVAQQIASFGLLDTRNINNLAGKYVAMYGTPFDLEELKNEVGLDVNNITHIRIIDVVGSIQDAYATYDAYGNKVNDPWTTPFASSGFDLDAVGVINVNTATSIASSHFDNRAGVYPNPLQKDQDINLSLNVQVDHDMTVQIFNYSGQLIKEQITGSQQTIISTEGMDQGLYLLKVRNGGETITKKIIIN